MIGLGPGLIAKNGLGKIEATGTPKNALLGGDDCATGMMGRALRESVQIAKTFSAKFIKIIDPRNQFFLNNW